MALQLQSLSGLIVIPLLAWAMSVDREAVRSNKSWQLIGGAIVLQFAIAGTMLNVEFLRNAISLPAQLVATLQAATNEGTRFVFGYLAGGASPFEVVQPQHSFVLAFQVLPIILLVSVLSRLLYHWGMLQRVVALFSWALNRTLGVGGPVGTASAANIFVGMVEAPLLIRPYVAKLSTSGLFAVMTVGMATIAGTVLALYGSVLSSKIPGAAGHLVVASVMNVPAALMLAALIMPERNRTANQDEAAVLQRDDGIVSSMDAIAQGTQDGIVLLANVAAMLIVMLALVFLANQFLALASMPFGITVTLPMIAGWIFAPLAFVIGVPLSECLSAGELLGLKLIINELFAYLRLTSSDFDGLSDRTRLILTYALCGFSNFGSLGILIGGLVAIAPERRVEISALGARSIIAGTLATLMTGAIIGVLTPA